MPSRPVSQLMLRSTTVPITPATSTGAKDAVVGCGRGMPFGRLIAGHIPPVHGTCVGTVKLRGVPSGFRPVLWAFQCLRRNSAVNLPR